MPGKGNTTTQSSSSPPPQFLNAYSNLINQAGTTLANNPFQNYTGPLVAGLQPAQTEAINEIGGLQGSATPFINAAGQEFGAATTPLAPGVMPYFNAGIEGSPENFGNTIQSYLSPYTKDVTQATQAQFANLNAQQQNQLQGNAIAQGAFGGDRAAVEQGILGGQQAAQEAPVLAQIQQQGYQQAAQSMAQQQQLQMQAGQGILGANEANAWLASQAGFGLGNLGAEQQNLGLSGAEALLGAGGLEQQIAQEQLNVPYYQFEAQQGAPYQELNWLAGITEGAGGLAGGMSSTTEPGPSTGQQVVGGAMDAASLALMFSMLKHGGSVPGRPTGGGILSSDVPTDIWINDLAAPRMATGHGPPAPPPATSPSNGNANAMQAMELAAAFGRRGSRPSASNMYPAAASSAGVAPDVFMYGGGGGDSTFPPFHDGGGILERAPGGGLSFIPGGNGIMIPQLGGGSTGGAPSAGASDLVPAGLIGNFTPPPVSKPAPATTAPSAGPSAPSGGAFVPNPMGGAAVAFDPKTGLASDPEQFGFGKGTPVSVIQNYLGNEEKGYGNPLVGSTFARGGIVERQGGGGMLDDPLSDLSDTGMPMGVVAPPPPRAGIAAAAAAPISADSQPSPAAAGPPPPPQPGGILPASDRYAVDYEPRAGDAYQPDRHRDMMLTGASLLAGMGAQAVARRPNYGVAIGQAAGQLARQRQHEDDMAEKAAERADQGAYRKADLKLHATEAMDRATQAAAQLKRQEASDQARHEEHEENLARLRSSDAERAAQHAESMASINAARGSEADWRRTEQSQTTFSPGMGPDKDDPTKQVPGAWETPKYPGEGRQPQFHPGMVMTGKETGDVEARIMQQTRTEADALARNYERAFSDQRIKEMPSNADIWDEAEKHVRSVYRQGATLPGQGQQQSTPQQNPLPPVNQREIGKTTWQARGGARYLWTAQGWAEQQ